MAYKVSNAVVNPTPVIIISDFVDGSVDSGMSDIMVESDYCVNFSRKWYLQVFDTAVFLAETLNRMNDNFKTIYLRISGQDKPSSVRCLEGKSPCTSLQNSSSSSDRS